MAEDDIVDMVLFVSRMSAASHQCKELLNGRSLQLAMVHLDDASSRKRVMTNMSFKITHVPTLLLIYRNQTASKLVGLEDIRSWLDTYYPVQDEGEGLVEEEKVSSILEPPKVIRRDAPASQGPVADEEFGPLNEQQFQQSIFDDDTVFFNPDEHQSRLTGTPITSTPSNGKSVQQMAEEMRAHSGLNYG